MLTQYFTASSLDGFVAAEPEDGLAWLLTREGDADGPQGYNVFIAEVGAIAMGATTYQWLLDNNDGPWPYEIPAWVFTHRSFPPIADDIRFTSDSVPAVHSAMVEAAAGKTPGSPAGETSSASSTITASWTRSGSSTPR
jgi:hypothetical protein